MHKSWLALLAGLLILIYSPSQLAGQEVLDSLIKTALENHPEISAASYMQESAAASSKAAGALPDPVLSLGILNLPQNSFSLSETPMSGVVLGLSQKIPWPGKLSAQSSLADIQAQKSRQTTESIKNSVIRQVKDTYYEYSYWTKSQSIIEEYLQLLEDTREIAEIRYANGDASAQDFLRVSSMLSRTQIRLLKSEQKIHSALLELWRAVGDTVAFNNPQANLPEPAGPADRENSVSANPMFVNALLENEHAEAQKRLAHRNYFPDLTLGIDYRLRREIPGDPVQGTDFLSFKLGLSFPLWFFDKQSHQVKSAQKLTLASRERIRFVRDILTTKLNDARSNLEFIIESLKSYDDSIVPEAQAALEAAEVAYEVGQIDFNALLAAQSDLFEIQIERLDLLRQYHQTRAKMAELAGTINER